MSRGRERERRRAWREDGSYRWFVLKGRGKLGRRGMIAALAVRREAEVNLDPPMCAVHTGVVVRELSS
jgi:hypothetical protein